MRILLDTHIFLWAILADRRLPKRAENLILDPAAIIHVSAASIWEIAIKHARFHGSPSQIPISGSQAAAFCAMANYVILDIKAAHAAAVEALPPLHQDPFDRMLVAQALSEPLRLVTSDRAVQAYDSSIVLV